MTESEMADRARDYAEAVEWRRAMKLNVERLRAELVDAEAKLIAANIDVEDTRKALTKIVKGEL